MAYSIFTGQPLEGATPASENKVSPAEAQPSANYLKALSAQQNAERDAVVNQHATALKEQELSRAKKALDMASKPLSSKQWAEVLENDPVYYYSDDAANLRRQHSSMLGMHYYS